MEKMPLNLAIISNPLNWFTVTLMFIIACIGYKAVSKSVNERNKNG